MAKKPRSPGRIAKLLANPGTRAALDSKFLTPAQRSQRELNQRLDSPVTSGSSLTQRDLAHQRNAALQAQYGPQEQQLGQELSGQQQLGRDLAAGYDAYLNDLKTHAANVQANNKAAVDATTALQANIGNMTSDTSGGDASVAGDAAKATAIRQALAGSFGAMMTAQGNSSNTYADTLANVVAPGQKLQSTAQQGRNEQSTRDKLYQLAVQKGAAGKQYDAETIASEAKNVLANQALGLDVAKATSTATNQRATRRERARHNKAQEQAAANDPSKQKTQAELDFFRKHGYWPPTGPTKPKAPKAVDPVKQAASDFYGKYGIKPASQASVSSAQTQIGSAKTWVAQIRGSNKGMNDAEIIGLLTRGQAADKKSGSPAIPSISELWVRVAIDLAGPRHRISNDTANRLHHAGYSVKALGLPSVGTGGARAYPNKGGSGAGQ